MGIEILHYPHRYMNNLDALPPIQQYGRIRDTSRFCDFYYRIHTKNRIIKIFYQKKVKV